MAVGIGTGKRDSLDDAAGFRERIESAPRPGEMRWAVHRMPGAEPRYVLQQQWTWTVEERNAIGSVRGSFEAEWRDVPQHEVPYTPAK